MSHPLSRYAASPSLLAAQGRGTTPSGRGGPSSVSLAFRVRRFCEPLVARSAMDN